MAAKEHVPDQDELALMQRTPAVIAPGHTFESVTDSISSIVLTKRTTIGSVRPRIATSCSTATSRPSRTSCSATPT